MRTVDYDPAKPAILLIDQRQLPGNLEVIELTALHQVTQAIEEMAVRGAPAIGITAALGLALAGRNSSTGSYDAWMQELRRAGEALLATRPTAVNLRWAVDRIFEQLEGLGTVSVPQGAAKLEQFAMSLADEDVDINRRMGQAGAALLPGTCTVIHHCNTGSLATVDYGTALGVIRTAHENGKKIHVLVDETRPRLQGARLTAWELSRYGISYDLIIDSAAGYFLQRGKAQAVLVGADRIAANGDVANKIGTYMLALAANASSVPLYCVAPSSTFDLGVETGAGIPIEERPPAEVLSVRIGQDQVIPAGAQARNPAFDITPAALVTAFVTEHGVIYPPYAETIPAILKEE